jgi:hypothetical protein
MVQSFLADHIGLQYWLTAVLSQNAGSRNGHNRRFL